MLKLTTSELKRIIDVIGPLTSKAGTAGTTYAAAIHIAGDGRAVTAMATDRYVAGVLKFNTANVPEEGGWEFAAAIQVADLKRIHAGLGKFDEVMLQAQDERVIATSYGTSMTVPAEADFPKIGKLFAGALDAVDPEAPSKLFDVAKMGQFKNAAKDARRPVVVHMTTGTKPIVVTAGPEFLGMLMPMRVTDGQIDELQGWSAAFSY